MRAKEASLSRISSVDFSGIFVGEVLTTVESTVIVDHEHDLPFHDVVVHQAAAYAWDVLVCLHLLQLAT